ncbi:MAG: acyltransferase family protein [Thermodesulfobacteriota bacterium]
MKRERDCNLDLLKAIAIVFVLLWHLRPVALTPVPLTNSLPYFLINIFNNKITLIAVPLFYLISNRLFLENVKTSSNYVSQRITRILTIYLFWTLVQIVLYYITFFVFEYFRWGWPIEPRSLFKHIIMGGPSLPIVGDSVFYFLFNLLLLTCIAFIYSKIKEEWRFKLSCLLVVLYCLYFLMLHFVNAPIPYWRIDNFIVYIPLADICLKKNNRLFFFLSLSLFGAFILYEHHQYEITSIYARNSILFGTLSFYLGVNEITLKRLPGKINLLSFYSLGIFSLHKYWMMIFIVCLSLLFNYLHINQQIRLATSFLSILQFFAATLAFLFTILTVYVMNLSKYLRKYVR